MQFSIGEACTQPRIDDRPTTPLKIRVTIVDQFDPIVESQLSNITPPSIPDTA